MCIKQPVLSKQINTRITPTMTVLTHQNQDPKQSINPNNDLNQDTHSTTDMVRNFFFNRIIIEIDLRILRCF